MHLTDGQLRACLDNQADVQTQKHVQNCSLCHSRLENLAIQSTQIDHIFMSLDQPVVQTNVTSGRAHFSAYISRKENHNMLRRLFSRKNRLAWIGLGLVAILALAMAFPPVRAIANNFLGLFRVERVTVIQVNQLDLPEGFEDSANLEALFMEDMQVSTQGDMQEVAGIDEAATLAGIPIRLPSNVEGELKLEVQLPSQMNFQVNLSRIQAIMAELGLADVELPQEINGALVTADIPSIVYATYGECDTSYEEVSDGYDPDNPRSYPTSLCTQFVQMASPTITAPSGVDLQQIGQVYLELLGMDREEAYRFSKNIDWSTTLVLPLPMDGYEFSEVSVDGVTGTLISSARGNYPSYTLFWVADGITYALFGTGGTATALTIVDSIK